MINFIHSKRLQLSIQHRQTFRKTTLLIRTKKLHPFMSEKVNSQHLKYRPFVLFSTHPVF